MNNIKIGVNDICEWFLDIDKDYYISSTRDIPFVNDLNNKYDVLYVVIGSIKAIYNSGAEENPHVVYIDEPIYKALLKEIGIARKYKKGMEELFLE